MKQKIKSVVIMVGFFVVLFIMYGTEVGIPGIEQYWREFKLLDMQFTYSRDTVENMIAMLGMEGIQHYLYYFLVDLCFIGILGCVQIQLSKYFAGNREKYKRVLYGLVIGRAVLDLCEDALLTLIFKDIILLKFVSLASIVTSFKFICLILWVFALIAGKVILCSMASTQ